MSNNNSKPEEESFIDKMKQRALADHRAEKIKNMEANKSSERNDAKEHELDERATKMANDEKDLSNI